MVDRSTLNANRSLHVKQRAGGGRGALRSQTLLSAGLLRLHKCSRNDAPFCRFPCSPSPSVFLFRWFCPVVLSFSVCFFVSASSLLLSLPCFPWWRIMLFCSFVSALHPPRVLCAPEVCVFPLHSVFLHSCCWFVLFFSHPFFRFRFGHRLFHPVFLLWVD